MKTMEWNNKDKSKWPNGPWNDEPDKKQWEDKDTGLACLIVRNMSGALCGYVGVPSNHKYHGKHYDDLGHPDCHGGLTFASGCQGGDDPSKGICHIPGEGEPDDTWWFGFDCAHCDDIAPGYEFSFEYGGVYRTIEYVEKECKNLAKQLASFK